MNTSKQQPGVGPAWRAGAAAVALLACVAQTCAAAALEVTVTDAAGHPLADTVVAVYGAAAAGRPAATAVIDQVDKQFAPRLLSISTGDAVSFPNSDNIRHHVYSFSPAKTFELPLYHGVPSAPVTFDKAGKVVLGCNIHDRMSAHVFVLDTPWHGVSSGGTFTVSNLAPGTYRVALFHPRHDGADPLLEREIEVDAVAATTELTIAAALPPAAPPAASALSPLEQKFKALRDAQD